jgi:hypothetical protein
VDRVEAARYIKSLTPARQSSTLQAVKYLGEGRSLRGKPQPAKVMAALLALEATDGEELRSAVGEALAHYARVAIESQFDTSAELLAVDTVLSTPARLRAALEEVAKHTTTRTLASITSAAVSAAQQTDPYVVEALAVVAGLTSKELRSRTDRLRPPVKLPGPGSRGPWSPRQVQAAFDVIDRIVRDETPQATPGTTPMRPVELLLDDSQGTWQAVATWLAAGVPYEMLLTQRVVGSAWGTHRNSTSGKVQDLILSALAAQLDERGVGYKKHGRARFGADTVAGQVRLTVGDGRLGVVVSVANDGGTANKSGAAMLRLADVASISLSIVLVGRGWSERRETVSLVRAFSGRIYSERTLNDLVDDLAAEIVGPPADNGEISYIHRTKG